MTEQQYLEAKIKLFKKRLRLLQLEVCPTKTRASQKRLERLNNSVYA